jgi:hypothetical protein
MQRNEFGQRKQVTFLSGEQRTKGTTFPVLTHRLKEAAGKIAP